MKPCEVCQGDDIVAVCDEGGDDFHALCRDCAGPYLTTTLFSQSRVPAVGERVKCLSVGCHGMLEVDHLTRGMDPGEKRKVDAQMARSTIGGMSTQDASNTVYCDMCEEYYIRDDPGDVCFRCSGKGKLIAQYVPDPGRADAASEALIKQTTMPCLRCGAHIHRTDGCNHMTCSICKHEFCYVCGRDWGAPPRCQSFMCRSRKRAAPADGDGDAACSRCALRGVRGANCPHVPLRPGGANCRPTCPRDCTCECSAWIMAWLQFRPSPGANPEYFNPTMMSKVNVAHLACVRTRGMVCPVCGLFGHSPDGQRGRSHCPVIEMVEHARGGA